ncbi:hypothetical protein [Levilactobacillus yonginensis]|uniref:hypothetical protein n=1 Tax=Levilactobacillus yonginensis TaxID=1054041 RepID=UPI00345CEFA4
MKPSAILLLIGTTLTTTFLVPTSVQASEYSAARANSVRLVWRHSMHQHLYHTHRGSRYSKHLGIRYARNTEDITWLTNAHEKLYDKRTHKAAIYYHVNSFDGRHGGWIWRGYLTPGGATVKPSPINNPSVDSGQEQGQRFDNTVRSLFPGTVNDDELRSQASAAINPSDGERSPRVPAGQIYIRLYNQVAHPTAQSYREALITAGYPAAKLATFKDWHIGVATQTDQEFGEGVNFGDVAIYLAPQR